MSLSDAIIFEYRGQYYKVGNEARFGNTDILMPDGTHVRADSWTKGVPMQPSSLRIVPAGQEAANTASAELVEENGPICTPLNPGCEALGCRSSADLAVQATYPVVILD